jgi:hypothetical protein
VTFVSVALRLTAPWLKLGKVAKPGHLPGVQLRFNKAETPQATTKGRVFDHIGFDVKDLKAFIKTLEADNIKLDRPYTVNTAGVALAFITDPWGAYIEMNERPAP